MKEIKSITGPYLRKDGRMHTVIRFVDGTKTTKSYPKYLIEQKLGRLLENDETVDHINRDISNNSYDNLQILSRSENAKKSAIKAQDIFHECCWCGKNFKLTRSQIKNYKRKSGPFCSRKCSGQYGAELQNKRVEKLGKPDIVLKYKSLDGIEKTEVIIGFK